MPSLPPKMKILSILAKTAEKEKLNFSRSVLFHMKTRLCLKYYGNGCSLIKQNVGVSHNHMCSNLVLADISEVSVGYLFAYLILCVFFIFNYLLYLFILLKKF